LSDRLAALGAALLAALLVTTAVAGNGAPSTLDGMASSPEGQVLAGRSSHTGFTHDRVPMPPPTPEPVTVAPTAPQPPPQPVVTGTASNYPGTAGFMGQPVVALPGAMGGQYTGNVQGYVTICADRCARLAVVDWCQCYWDTADQRVADISQAAWPLITNKPLSSGLVQARVILDDPRLAAIWTGG
jgi:hypothetical protein